MGSEKLLTVMCNQFGITIIFLSSILSCMHTGAYNIVVNQPAMITNHRGDSGHGPIRFYNRDEPFYEFTNFYPAPIDLDGETWPTTEHYFQAQKFIGTSYPKVIRNFERPRQAFEFSRNPTVSRWRRSDWEDIKISIMRKALLAKFTQHKNLRQMLLRTGDRRLIEHSPRDKFWGNGGDDSGENRLGWLLMEVRQFLIDFQTSLYKQEETVVVAQPNITPDSHHECVQRSESTEKDGRSRRSSSSSSSMEYTNEEAGHGQDQSHQVPENQDPQKNDLIRSPLHPMATEGQQQGEGTPASSGTAPPPTQNPMDPPTVDDLIDLREPEHTPEDKGNPLMEDHDSSKLAPPIEPMSISNQPECTIQAPDTSTDVAGKASSTSSSNEGDLSEERMDTA